MLTDPLESGMDQDGRVMEECMLGNCRVRVPEDLLEDVSYQHFLLQSSSDSSTIFMKIWKYKLNISLSCVHMCLCESSQRFSSRWWVRAHGQMFSQMLSGHTFVNSCLSFQRITPQSRTPSSAIFSTTRISSSETPCTLPRSSSEVNPPSLLFSILIFSFIKIKLYAY